MQVFFKFFLKTLPERSLGIRMGFILISILMAMGLIYFFGLSYFLNSQENLKAQMNQNYLEQEIYKNQLKILSSKKEFIKIQEVQLENFLRQLNSPDSINLIQGDLADQAIAAGLLVQSSNQNLNQGGDLTGLFPSADFQMVLIGNYQDFKKYLDQVFMKYNFIKLTEFSIEKINSESSKLQMTIQWELTLLPQSDD